MSQYLHFSFLFICCACQNSELPDKQHSDVDQQTDGIDPQDDDLEPQDDDEEVPEQEQSFIPLDGTWTILDSSYVQDDCNLEELSDRGTPGSTIDILNESADRFSIDPT